MIIFLQFCATRDIMIIQKEMIILTIGQLITEKRKEKGMTLEDVGRAVGVSKATVSRWESGDIQKMKRDKIAALSKTLGIDPIVLLSTPEILSDREEEFLHAFREADPVFQDVALKILKDNPRKKTITESSAI